ncbi:MAG: lipoyl domain-containing protein [Planctomycetaceae bacterium]
MSSSPRDPRRVPVIVPELDARTSPMQLVQWLVDAGTSVQAGDRIAELLVSGVIFHLAAPEEGVLSSRVVRDRAPVQIGDVLGWIDVD